MKLIQALKITTEAGLSAELRYHRSDTEFGPESMSLYGVRTWVRHRRFDFVDERDTVVVVGVTGSKINPTCASHIHDRIAAGLADSNAREAKANAA